MEHGASSCLENRGKLPVPALVDNWSLRFRRVVGATICGLFSRDRLRRRRDYLRRPVDRCMASRWVSSGGCSEFDRFVRRTCLIGHGGFSEIFVSLVARFFRFVFQHRISNRLLHVHICINIRRVWQGYISNQSLFDRYKISTALMKQTEQNLNRLERIIRPEYFLRQ